MNDDIEIIKRRFEREKLIRRQAEKIAEEKSRELYLKGMELEKALEAESLAKKEIEALYNEVARLSRIDPLTELLNRRSFSVEANRIFQLAIRHQQPLSCAMADIDFFKRVNDTQGHDAGDKVLIAVAKACQKEIRQTDLLARFGGEEFCFLFPETDLKGAAKLSERIRVAVAELEFGSAENRFSVTVSIGLSEFLDVKDDLESMLKRSDQSLYKAKESGRNRVVINGK